MQRADARRGRHEQHRQLLARVSLADLVRAAQVVRAVGRDRLVHRHRSRRRGDPDRCQPDPGSPGRRRPDQAGGAARLPADHDRSAPDRACRLRVDPPLAAPGDERRGRALGLCHVVRRDGLTDPAFIAERTDGYEAVEELLERVSPRGGAGDHRHPRRRPRAGGSHLRRGRQRARSSGVSA